MPVAGGGFEPAYNAQVGVDTATMRVVAVGVTQSPNDKAQVDLMLATLQAQAEVVLGHVESLIANGGFCGEKNLPLCENAGIEPLIAVTRGFG